MKKMDVWTYGRTDGRMDGVSISIAGIDRMYYEWMDRIFNYSKLAQIALVGPGIHSQNGRRDNFTRGPPCLLPQHIWRLSQHETTSHLCFLSEACLYPHSSLMMQKWGPLQRKMARKNTHLQSDDFTRFVLVHSLKQRATTVTCVT